MTHIFLRLMVVAIAPILGGCVAGIAASAISLAAQSARGKPVDNQALKPQAREACSAQASQYGTVQVIDVEQHSLDKIIVWGTVDDGNHRRSFQCNFGTKITSFIMRPIIVQR